MRSKERFVNAHDIAVLFVSDKYTRGIAPPTLSTPGASRIYAFSSFNSINGAWLRLSQNNATGNGGTCHRFRRSEFPDGERRAGDLAISPSRDRAI